MTFNEWLLDYFDGWNYQEGFEMCWNEAVKASQKQTVNRVIEILKENILDREFDLNIDGNVIDEIKKEFGVKDE